MSVTVILELRFKPESVAAGRELMGRTLEVTRAFDGNIQTDVWVDEDDEAYRHFRAGEGKVTELPPLLAAPPNKTRYTTADV